MLVVRTTRIWPRDDSDLAVRTDLDRAPSNCVFWYTASYPVGQTCSMTTCSLRWAPISLSELIPCSYSLQCRVADCIAAVADWMSSHRFQLNTATT